MKDIELEYKIPLSEGKDGLFFKIGEQLFLVVRHPDGTCSNAMQI